jgi:hypothetical protein
MSGICKTNVLKKNSEFRSQELQEFREGASMGGRKLQLVGGTQESGLTGVLRVSLVGLDGAGAVYE